jgi:hypothetical protein
VNKSIGAHRLAIFIGSIATVAWLVVIIFLLNAVQHIGLEEVIFIIVGMILCFVISYLFVKGVFWVKDGFNKDRLDS